MTTALGYRFVEIGPDMHVRKLFWTLLSLSSGLPMLVVPSFLLLRRAPCRVSMARGWFLVQRGLVSAAV